MVLAILVVGIMIPAGPALAGNYEWFTLQAYPDHALPMVIEDPTRARWTGDRLGGTLFGEAAGASRMSLRVFRGTTTVWEAPPLNLVVR